MEKQEITPKMQRHRKFMLVLPFLILPFLTLAFWALGGGKLEAAQAASLETKGFNLNLPDANLKEKPMDKMRYYEQAQKDSARIRELQRNDAASLSKSPSEAFGNPFSNNPATGGLNTSVGGGYGSDPNAENIYRKLELLNQQLNKPATTASAGNYGTSPEPYRSGPTVGSADVNRLEKMIQAMDQPGEPDPELAQLNSMLEKLMDIQNPGRVKEQLDQAKEEKQQQAYKVSLDENKAVTLLDNTIYSQNTDNGFYGLDEDTGDTTTQNAIPAVIHETQTLVNGAIVKLRLQEGISVNGVPIPNDSFIFGVASLSGERLNIEITNLRNGNSIFPVNLQVFDIDGLDGIHIPGAITRDVAANSADRSVQGIGLTSLDPTWQGQAASAGIETAKTLFSRKVKLVKVTVKAGYQVLLRDGRQQQATVQLNPQH